MTARFVAAGFEMHSQFVKHIAGIGQDIHQMRNRCALISAHIGYAGLKQGLGHGEDAFADKGLPLAEAEFVDFGIE